jgi:hypothetical protein
MNTSQKQLEDQILSREWFYEFPLPGGKYTRSYLPEFARSIHTSRAKMLFDFLNSCVGGDWHELQCLDLACHEGYFALKLALKGCRRVVGLDARREHLESAALIRQVHGLGNLTFVHGDVQRLDASTPGVFDVVLAFGILYHVHDLVGTIRNLRAVTGGVCLIETQVAPELDGSMEWGSQEWSKPIQGCLALVDEADDLDSGIKETGLSPVSLVPSLRGLLFMLERAGFERTAILEPGPDAHEQHRRGKRVMVAAFPVIPLR